MKTRKVILYIAMSLDGYIATNDGDLTWLDAVQVPGEDYGYNAFVSSVDTVIMGRKTYDKVLTFDIPFPHKGRMCYVLSNSKQGVEENVTFYNGDLKVLIADLKSKEGADIFVDGGANIVNELMKQGLIDKYIISVIPAFLGGGIRLFDDGRPGETLKLLHTAFYPSGLVQMWYDRV